MKYAIVLFLSFLCGCCNDYNERSKATFDLVNSFEKKMREKRLRFAGISEEVNHDTKKQKLLGVSFYVETLPDVATARKLMIDTINELISRINSNDTYKAYMDIFPFTIENVEITIFSENKKGGLSWATNFTNEISYYDNHVTNPTPTYGPLKVHSETYEEALKICR